MSTIYPIVNTNIHDNIGYMIGQGSFGKVYTIRHDWKHVIKRFIYESSYIDEFIFYEMQIHSMMNECKYVPKIKEIHLNCTYADEIRNYHVVKMDRCKNTISDSYINSHDIHRLISQLIYVLATAQSKMILHGDITCNNIMIDENNDIALIDWGSGIVKYSDYHIDILSQTLHYRCPEQLLRMHKLMNNDTVDMWSVGLIMIEMFYNLHTQKYRRAFSESNLKENEYCKYIHTILKTLGNPKDETLFDRIRKLLSKNDISIDHTDRSFDTLFDELKSEHNLDDDCVDFMKKLLQWSHVDRFDPISAYNHPYIQKYVKFNDNFNIISCDKFEQFKNLGEYHICKSDILLHNEWYVTRRKNYFDSYETLLKNKYCEMTYNELNLMMILTDKLMSVKKVENINYDIIQNSVANIVHILFEKEQMSNHAISCWMPDIVYKHDGSCKLLRKIHLCIYEIMEVIGFPIKLLTCSIYGNLFKKDDSRIKYLYFTICKVVIQNIDYIEYTSEQLFGSILHSMSKYEIISGNHRFNINFPDDLKCKYPKYVDISIPANIRDFRYADSHIKYIE